MVASFLQDDALQELGRSKVVVASKTQFKDGQIHELLFDDRRKEFIGGNHRNAKGFKRVTNITTKDDLEFWVLKMHDNVQRQKPQSEFSAELSEYAKVLEKAGFSNSEIVEELKNVSPYHPDYTTSFIPNRYLSNRGKPTNEEFRGRIELEKSLIHLPDSFSVGAGQDLEKKQDLVTCSRCSFRGYVVARVLQQSV